MKKLFFLFCFLVVFNLVSAQIIFEPNIVEAQLPLTNSFQEFHVDIKNENNEAVSFYWVIVPDSNVPVEWTFFVCDNYLCYAPGILKCPNANPVNMEPNTEFPLKITLNANNVPAQIGFRIELYEFQN